jgi:hypoxanthine phosphoribosyltransferase
MSFLPELEVPFSLREEDVRVGPVAGFYPMPDNRLWVTATVQHFDSMSLAEIVKEELPQTPDVEIVLARGAFTPASSAVYYNGAPIVAAIQTEQYLDDSDEGRRLRPRIVSAPDWQMLRAELEARNIEDPLVLIRDDLSDHRRALRLARDTTCQGLGIDPNQVHTAVLYVKDAEEDLDPGETCADDIIVIDHYVRHAPGVWLDHQTQASPETLRTRQRDIMPYAMEMRQAAAFFETVLVPDPALMQRVIERSAADYTL